MTTLLIIRLMVLGLIVLFLLSALVVHLRSRVRLKLGRQLASHATLFAPYNLLMYAFSAVPAGAFPGRKRFPEVDALRDNWQTIRDEAAALSDEGHIRDALKGDDASFSSFLKQGWKRFYVKWYGEPLPSAQKLCPKTVALVNAIPGVKAAMFASLPPGVTLNLHRDPFAGSLRYHLGLMTPNSDACHIVVNGENYSWRDGQDVVFDETCAHWVENRTDTTRVILMCDVERPLKSRVMGWLNHHVSNFMGAITASPNQVGEPTGAVNRLFASLRRRREASRAFKQRHRGLFKTVKFAGGVVVLWVLLLAPWPII
ncbi:MAG TPA: aspartyl/asparaginyl beta-hydroxylase domain-containing protein [Rhodanobacteraceae bacterium]|nr:aspartyl/asparaginyl beta-hydroxylase domain-containing protein [Rhodanobacteraceae bacterium]